MIENEASEEEHEGPQNASVYDFLYHDARRIGSFLAQFDDSGHLQQIRQSESAAKSSGQKSAASAGGGVPLVAQGQASHERTAGTEGRESLERVYDPLWSNARTLLDYLEAATLIHRDITNARIGQFVIASGNLSVLNAAMLPKIWESASIRDLAIRSSVNSAKDALKALPKNPALRPADREKLEKEAIRTAEATSRTALDLLPAFPHSAQCTITGGNFSVWSSLSAEGLVSSAADLSLKHGTEIPGTWHLLGILDALPDKIAPQILIPPNPPNVGLEHMGKLIKNFSNIGRQILGRSEAAYGVTALLLFREVSAGS